MAAMSNQIFFLVHCVSLCTDMAEVYYYSVCISDQLFACLCSCTLSWKEVLCKFNHTKTTQQKKIRAIKLILFQIAEIFIYCEYFVRSLWRYFLCRNAPCIPVTTGSRAFGRRTPVVPKVVQIDSNLKHSCTWLGDVTFRFKGLDLQIHPSSL